MMLTGAVWYHIANTVEILNEKISTLETILKRIFWCDGESLERLDINSGAISAFSNTHTQQRSLSCRDTMIY